MANHVFNEVNFHGQDADLMVAAHFFEQMEACEPKTEEAQWPHFFIEMPKRFFAHIEGAHLPGVLRVEYETDWYPNPEDLVTIAAHFGLDFESTYIEHGNGYYGACRYKFDEGNLLHTWLGENDFMQIGCDDQKNEYLYKERRFKFQGTCYNHVLKEKLDVLEQFIGQSRGR
ncbi:hypothetical protein ABIE26_004475 [Pedobacter africanus]|uniref:Uncharacterized protein n=1 Tax=Pedobacter africanus TaxID=151894 RepID=A0ACC6L329_9SPHI|nr:hypothetical protein [Pedobacter africanus]MDR6786055.1 hypothetical protein [Pedobacter africanus]